MNKSVSVEQNQFLLASGEVLCDVDSIMNLKDFIPKRFNELDQEEAPLRDQLKKIAAEREQLYRAARAAGISLDGELEFGEPEQEQETGPSRQRIPGVTMKEAALTVLQGAGRAMTALEILAGINEKYAVDFERSSLSPQLSRLKDDGLIESDGTAWSLTQNGAGGSKTRNSFRRGL